MSSMEFQQRKHAFDLCVDDTLNVFLAREKGASEYLDDDLLAEAHARAWGLLSEEQKKEIWGLSADLYALTDNEKVVVTDDQPDDQTLASMINDAYEKQDWRTLLRCFRFQPVSVERETIEYMRGRAWAFLGFPRVSLAFYDNASRIQPASATYRYFAMNQVKKLGDWEELQRRCERSAIEMADDAMMQLVVGELYHDIAMNKPKPGLDMIALEHLDRGFQLVPSQNVRESILGSAVASRAFVLTNLQRMDDALQFLDSWIKKLPKNAELRSTRGLIYLTLDYAKAIADFEEAIRFGTALALPYLEVAKNMLNQRHYKEIEGLCRKGIQLSHRDAARAEFHHLLGLLEILSKQNEWRSQQEFIRATGLAPFNQAIRNNERLMREGSRGFTMPKKMLRSLDEIMQSRRDIAEAMSVH